MKETLELRVWEEHAPRLFADDEGEKLGHVRRIVIPTSDGRLPAIASLDRELRDEDPPINRLFSGWSYHRRYSRAELSGAPLLAMRIGHSVHLSGEIAGTIYDTASACPVCGAGRRRLSPLRLHLGKVPRLKDIVQSGSGEWIVSGRFVDACERLGATGASFSPVEFRRAPTGLAPAWYEMTSTAPAVSIYPDTRCASGPFPDPDRDARAICPLGDTIGHTRITEVRVSLDAPPEADVNLSREYQGGVLGLFQPHRELILSNRLYVGLLGAGIRGLRVEVARLRGDRDVTM